MSVFGSQLRYAAEVIKARRRPADAGGTTHSELQKRLKLASEATKVVIQVVVSLTVLVTCFGLIKSSPDEPTKKGCFALIGTVVGYWLR